MTTPTRALQKAIKAKIDAASVGATVYDGPAPSAAFPRIVFGASTWTPDNADDITAQDEIIQIDVYSRDNGELHPCKDLVNKVYVALHEVELALDDPWASQFTYVRQARTFLDPDEKTAHGVLTLEVGVQTVS